MSGWTRLRRRFGRHGGVRFDRLHLATLFLVTRLLIFAVCHLGAAYRAPPGAWSEVDGPPPPAALAPLVRWDGVFYVSLARFGYPASEGGPVFHAAFFPLYPLLTRAATGVLGDTVVAALVISNLCALAAALLLLEFARTVSGRRGARVAALLFVVSPGAHFLSLPYSEGLFALLCAAFLFAESRGRVGLATVAALLATATRSTGVALTGGMVIRALRASGGRERAAWLGGSVVSLGGLAAFAAFCEHRYGSWTYFSDLQAHWGRTPSVLGPLRALFAFNFDADYYLVTLLALGALVGGLKHLPLSWSGISAAMLWLPLATGSLKSMIRFQGVNLPLFITAARWSRRWATPVAFTSLALMLYEAFRYGAWYANN